MDNNKKRIVVVLAALILCVGAFQFIQGGDNKVAKKNAAKKTSSALAVYGSDPENPASKINDLVDQYKVSEDNPGALVAATPLSMRDPFAQGSAQLEVPPSQQPVTPPKPQRSAGTYVPGRNKPYPPITGDFPPMPPVTPDVKTPNQAGAPPRDPDAFAMRPIGIILGNHPAVVFVDDAGIQKLVPLGGSITEDAKVIGIEKDKVRVRHHNKELTLTVGGTPNAQ
jgi:hypothetical protein